MAWMLEETIKALTALVVGCFLKGVKRIMSEKCLIEKCMRSAASDKRGLCLVCYSAAKRKVDTGVITWNALAKAGLCKDKCDDPFDDAYTRAMEAM